MAFEGLTEKISSAFKHLRSKGRLTESDIKDAMKEIRMALLEADVNYQGRQRTSSRLLPNSAIGRGDPRKPVSDPAGHQDRQRGAGFALWAAQTTRLTISPNPPTIVMMAGLQGAGKTTNVRKAGRSASQAAAAPTAARSL